jgi:two-component system, cell cycle response regulator
MSAGQTARSQTIDPALAAALEREVERARRYRRSCAVMLVSLDHLTCLSDEQIQARTTALQVAVRGSDIAGHWQDNAFLAILPETQPAAALQVAERVRAVLACRPIIGHFVTCSIGIAVLPYDGDRSDTLLDRAERAVLLAKCLGGNQIGSASDPAVLALEDAPGGIPGGAGTISPEVLLAVADEVARRDGYGAAQVARAEEIAFRLSMVAGHCAEEARRIALATRLCDIGKVAVPDGVLQKNGSLDDAEWDLIRACPVAGSQMIGHAVAMSDLAPIVRSHHERWDGAGYPDGLAGANIPLGARVVAIARACMAMLAARPHRPAHGIDMMLSELRRGADRQFDPRLVAALERLFIADPSTLEEADVDMMQRIDSRPDDDDSL